MSAPTRSRLGPPACPPPLIPDRDRCCELAARALPAREATLRAALARVPDAADQEAVHDARVAARRLRVALRTLEACLPASTARALGDVVREIGATLGEARDAEVRFQRLGHWLTPLSVRVDRADALQPGGRHRPVVVPAGSTLAPGPRGQEPAAYRHLLDQAATTAERSRQAARDTLPHLLAVLAPVPAPVRGHPRTATVGALCRRRVRTAFRGAAAAPGPVGGTPPGLGQLHPRRIAFKRLRYTLELFGGVLPAVHHDILREVRALQDRLGDHQDLVVLAAFIHEGAATAPAAWRPALRRAEVRAAGARDEAAAAAWRHLEALDRAGYWSAAAAACRWAVPG